MPLVELNTPSGPMEALVSSPSTGSGPWPGVVLIHDVFGFGQDVKDISRRVADAGYVVVTPNLYSRGGGARCVTKVLRAMQSQQGEAFEDVRTARSHLEGLEECTGSIGVAGFCMGGQFAIVMATDGFKASAPFYGVPVPKNVDDLLKGSCPMVASFGSRDPLGFGSPARLRKALEANDVVHDVKVYEGVGHSFANKLPAQPIQRIVGFGYDQAATDDAWRRVFAFFAEHLK
jgi:carboxymethylenebutenolidase